MKYTLQYNRREVAFTLRWDGGIEVFNQHHLTAMPNYLYNSMEPGDTLEYLEDEDFPQ